MKVMLKISKAITASPPTTPPAMAPAGVALASFVTIGVEVGGSIEMVDGG